MRSDAVTAAAETPGMMGVSCLELQDVSCGYDGAPVLEHVSFTVQPGQVCCVLGRNGVGKTTLFSSILRTLPLITGRVLIGGEDASVLAPAQLAKRVAYVPQAHTPPFPFSVADVVILGRTPYINTLTHENAHDRDIAYKALETLGIQDLAHEVYTELSGGQQQLVLIARALAQQPDVLIMDEPTASLDFGNQQVVLSQMKNLVAGGMSVLMVTHDPNHAFYCADWVVAMQAGRVVQVGTPQEVVTTEMLERLYSAQVEVKRVHIDKIDDDRSVAISL